MTEWLIFIIVYSVPVKEIYNNVKQPFYLAESKVKKIAVLCAQRKSIYNHFAGRMANSHVIDIEIYDVKRNAFTFPGGMAVIAHPPCRLWGNLSHTVRGQPIARDKEKELGRFCVRAVISNGGILEQPFESRLFEDMGLPPGGMANNFGYTIELPQRMFGHEMIKNTWLFFSKIDYEDIEPIMPAIHGKPLKQIYNLSHKQRNRTPALMAEWLIKNVSKVKE